MILFLFQGGKYVIFDSFINGSWHWGYRALIKVIPTNTKLTTTIRLGTEGLRTEVLMGEDEVVIETDDYDYNEYVKPEGRVLEVGGLGCSERWINTIVISS